MKITLIIVSMLCSLSLFAQDKKYTEEEFVKAVAEQVKKQIENIKNKSVTELTKELVTKEESIKLKELELQKKEDQIKVNATELENKIKKFHNEQKDLLGCLQKNDNDQQTRVNQQVEVISNMQPAKAAQLLSVQEADISVRILQLLDPKKASKIFNLMDKEVSARLQKQYMNMKR
jgi:flagellar motility protein MotE (MotC chaperone)